jgi:hypothetical protein
MDDSSSHDGAHAQHVALDCQPHNQETMCFQTHTQLEMHHTPGQQTAPFLPLTPPPKKHPHLLTTTPNARNVLGAGVALILQFHLLELHLSA